MIDRLEAAPLWLHLIVLALAAGRFTILVIDDRITEAPRKWVRRKLPPSTYLGYMLGCYWCLGVWISTGLVACWLAWPGVTLAVSVGAAVSLFVPVIDHLTDYGPDVPPSVPPFTD